MQEREEGWQAYQDGIRSKDNPYDIVSEPQAHDAWRDGWNSASVEDGLLCHPWMGPSSRMAASGNPL